MTVVALHGRRSSAWCNEGELTYNEAMREPLRNRRTVEGRVAKHQHATLDELEREHVRNEQAAHRVRGPGGRNAPDA